MLPTSAPLPLEVQPQWIDYPLNWIGVSVSAVLFIISLKMFVELLPYLWGGMWWEKMILNLEASVSKTRDRNRLFSVCILPFCLLVSKYHFFTPRFMAPLGEGLSVLGVVGAVAAFFLLRWLISIIISSQDPKMSSERAKVSSRSIMNFWIMGCVGCGIVAIPLSSLGVNTLTIRHILIVIGIFIYLLFLVRRTQILLNFCNHLKAFLYLCALELIPLAAMVATGLFL